MPSSPAGNEISTILRHDSKQTSYKIALLRSINDVVLNFPDLADTDRDVAVPLLLLADFWIAYYWSFAHPDQPIYQGPRATLDGSPRNDMAFRPEFRALRHTFHQQHGDSTASDGFFSINELRVPRKRETLSSELLESYREARTKVARTIRNPIRYAGPGEWQVFPKPTRLRELSDIATVPGTSGNQSCLVVRRDLQRTGYRQHYEHNVPTYQTNVRLPYETVVRTEFCEIYQYRPYPQRASIETSDCPFCAPAEEDSILLTESAQAYAMLDQYPVAEGHALVLPKRHVESYFDLAEREQAACWIVVDRVKSILQDRHNPDGINVGINDGEKAGQTVSHTHVHVIPRYDGDVDEPTGGVRNVIPGKGNYLVDQ